MNEKISIVVPVFNSEDCIKTLVETIKKHLHGKNYELLLVNDCSKDKSWDEIQNVQKENPQVTGINLRKNSGQDNALMAGFSFASGNFVVIMDDDLQHHPKDIEKLLETIKKENCDVCFANFRTKKQKLWKNFGSWFNGKMAEIIINKPSEIYLSPFKAVRKEVIDEIIKYKGPYPYVDGLIFTITQNVTQIPIEHHKRFAGKSNFNLIRSIKVWLKLMTSFSVFPLRIATFIGMLSSFAGFSLAFFYLLRYLFVQETVEGWTTLVLITLFFSGIILLALGCIGEYVGRSYLQQNQRPQYTVKNILRS